MEHKTSDGWTARLGDDGSVDTLIVVTSPKGETTTERFSQEYAGDKRDASGALTEEGFKELAEEAIDAAADAAIQHVTDMGECSCGAIVCGCGGTVGKGKTERLCLIVDNCGWDNGGRL